MSDYLKRFTFAILAYLRKQSMCQPLASLLGAIHFDSSRGALLKRVDAPSPCGAVCLSDQANELNPNELIGWVSQG
ncbi:MAG: hypothetical protein ACRECH_15190 [Nitrososphaerales archaeon]